MTLLPPDLLARYLANPVACDREVRALFHVPENRYYTVTVYPVAGHLVVGNRSRVVHATKISKSSA